MQECVNDTENGEADLNFDRTSGCGGPEPKKEHWNVEQKK